MQIKPVPVDVLIFGGGAAGLWLLDSALRAGHHALLLEAGSLGSGQTIASQGIIHGGFKYTLNGAFSESADAIKQLPQRWRDCLAGKTLPDLSGVQRRSDYCHLWSTGRLLSKLGMMAASWMLKVKPRALPREAWPAPLRATRGSVSQLDEQVISPQGLIAELSRQHHDRILHVGEPRSYGIQSSKSGVKQVVIRDGATRESLILEPRSVVFTAGKGNAGLRAACGLSTDVMQIRPVHMIMARGALPKLNGHCIDGNKTRVTVTSDIDSQGRCVWQVGGQVSEDGVNLSKEELILHAKRELQAVLPSVAFTGIEWSTYRADKAEGATRGGARPNDAVIHHEGNIITCWPTKLVLAPIAADRMMAMLPPPSDIRILPDVLTGWPRPEIAAPPWEQETSWLLSPEALCVT